jgi:hypothetical protein
MKQLKEFDKIRLKTGQRGCIVEIFKDGTLLAEVVNGSGRIDIKELQKSDVKAIIKEVEVPLELS